jgi:hypothetical protein
MGEDGARSEIEVSFRDLPLLVHTGVLRVLKLGVALLTKISSFGIEEAMVPRSLGGSFQLDGETFFQARLAIERRGREHI